MLSAREIVESRERPPLELPTFGVKDFQPNGSLEESNEIQNSISEIKNLISYENIKVINTLSQAVWHPELHLAEVIHQVGQYWTYMGHKIDQKLYIFPEEALYLLEIGSLQILYNEVSLSVQRAYAVLLNPENNITIEKYCVYSALNNYGYKVRRHSPQNSVTQYEKQIEVHKLGIKLKNYKTVVKSDDAQGEELDVKYFERRKELKPDETKTMPVYLNKFTDVSDEFKSSKSESSSSQFNPSTNLKFDYDIYLETSEKNSFKKSCLQLPNFRVVVNRSDDSILELEELYNTLNKYKDDVPVVYAIVFPDYIAFYQMQPVILPNPYD